MRNKVIRGVTLIEMMLVLAIAVSLFLLAMNQYQAYRIQSSFFIVKQNVDVLFQALGQYYQANCRSLSDSAVANATGKSPSTATGDLAPGGFLKVDYTTANKAYTINIQNALMNNHYLPSNWPSITPIVDANSYQAAFIFQLGTKEYYACWNFYDNTGVKCNTALYFPSSPTVGPTPIQQNQVAFWLVQVSVQVPNDPDGSKTQAYAISTGASCASSKQGSCDTSGTPQYLIWQQLPTKSGSNINSDLWVSQQQEVMFNQQYTHDIMYEIANPNYQPSGTEPYYYLCGN